MKARMRSLLYDTACVADANEYVACSDSAGKSVFGNKPFAIITNAMNTSQYHFDPDARMQLRKSFGIENNTARRNDRRAATVRVSQSSGNRSGHLSNPVLRGCSACPAGVLHPLGLSRFHIRPAFGF